MKYHIPTLTSIHLGLLILLFLVSMPVLSSTSGYFPQWMPKAVDFANWENKEWTPMNMPGLASSRTDPDTGLSVWRLGGNAREMNSQAPFPSGKHGVTSTHSQHFYSRTSPVNSNETLVLGSAGRGKPYAALWRLSDKKLVAWVPSAQTEKNLQQRQLLWDRQDPSVYWYTEANRLMRAQIDLNTYQVKTQVWDQFDDLDYVTFGFGEGNFSDNGNRLVIGGESSNSKQRLYIPYDVKKRRKYSYLSIPTELGNVDWASVDPTGKYIVFQQAAPKQSMVLPFDNAHRHKPRLLFRNVKHSDFVLDKNGDSWLAYGDWRGLFVVRLRDSFHQRVWPVKTLYANLKCSSKSPDCQSASGHVARVAKLPGMLLVSRIIDGGIYFTNIDAPGYAVYVGNSRHGKGPAQAKDKKSALPWGVDKYGDVTRYHREARAAVSPSGHYVFFTSDYRVYGKHKGSYLPEPENRAYLNMIEVMK